MKASNRALITILVLSLIIPIYGQEDYSPTCYIDSIEAKVDFDKVHFNSMNITSITIDKEMENGAIYITTKNEYKLISIWDVLDRYTDSSILSDALLFFINGKLVEDYEGVLIDDSFFIYVEVNDLSNVNYIDRKFANLQVVSIDLEEKERPIMIK